MKLHALAAAVLIAGPTVTACGGAHPSPPLETTSVDSAEAIREPSDDEVASLRTRLECEKSDTALCRGLAAFPSAQPPSGRSRQTSLAGASALLAPPGADGEGAPPVYEASYLVLSDEAVRVGTVKPTNDSERADALALVQAVLAGQPLPGNPAVAFATSRTGAPRATRTSRSLTWSGSTRGFARQTREGVLVIESTPQLTMIGFFPVPAR